MAKAKGSLITGFKDPVSRPRYIIWTGVALIGLLAFIVFAFWMSSTRLFCAQVCHKVQDDTIIAYEKGSHSEIGCLACHEPVNCDPITLTINKANAGIFGAIHTIGNVYVLPLNKGSALSLNYEEMPERQCTQCHSSNRKITPSPGMIIDHKIHSTKGITCTTCHNRVAHPEEGWELTLKKVDGTPNEKHPNFMKMTACYRCHDLEGKKTAPGTCATCHTPDFELKPPSHLEKNFFPEEHAKLALEDVKELEAAAEEAKVLEEEGIKKELVEPVSYCSTCHIKSKFCDSCHGMQIPHPAEFKTKTHPEVVKTSLEKCVMCHGDNKVTWFCDDCHHGTQVAWTFDAKVPWKNQHATAVTKNGIDKCFVTCHDQKFCLDCHTQTKPFPSSHKVGNWLHRSNPDPFAKDKAVHAVNATSNIKACEICHGVGGTTSAFCMACHKQPMPHPAEFKSFHAKTGTADPAVCANCHQFRELCSNCHHKGSTVTASWISLHGAQVGTAGAADCFAKCHKKDFCVQCHTGRKVVPSSHKAADWTRRAALDKKALHPAAFTKDAENCTFCHGDGGASSAFCTGCHKLPMPHKIDAANTQKYLHKDAFAAKTITQDMCTNCHVQQFCDKCHHEYTGTTPWLTTHDDIVKQSDPSKCFKCHKETYCSYCHVRLIH